jgi:hypothetical protein
MSHDRLEKSESTWTGWIVPGVGLLIAAVLLVWTLAPHDAPSPSHSANPTTGDGRITTADGQVYVRASADGAHLELVLDKADGSSVVLAAIPEAMHVGLGSTHTVDCPPSTGFAQRYYGLGQHQGDSGTIEITGLSGMAAEIVDGLWLIAVTSDPVPSGSWMVSINGQEFAGGLGSTFLDLPTSGERSQAGCFYFL